LLRHVARSPFNAIIFFSIFFIFGIRRVEDGEKMIVAQTLDAVLFRSMPRVFRCFDDKPNAQRFASKECCIPARNTRE
jgi:hypothetical protein